MTDVKDLRDLIERLRELADHIGSAQYNADPWASSPSAQANSCRQAASALQSLVDRNAAMAEALTVRTWTSEEAEGMSAAFERARQKHGHYESLFAVGAWLLRHRLAEAARSALNPVEGE